MLDVNIHHVYNPLLSLLVHNVSLGVILLNHGDLSVIRHAA